MKVLLCCGHKHVEDLTFIAAGKCTDTLRVIELDPVNESTGKGVSLESMEGLSTLSDPEIRMRRATTLLRSEREKKDMVFNNRTMTRGCIVRAVKLQRLNNRGKPIGKPSSKITLAPAQIGGAQIVEDAVGTNSLRVKVRTWNGAAIHLRYRLEYTVQSANGVSCTL